MNDNHYENEKKLLIDSIFHLLAAIIDWTLRLFGIVSSVVVIFSSIQDAISSPEINWATILAGIPAPVMILFTMYLLYKKNYKRSVGAFGAIAFSSYLLILSLTPSSVIIFSVTGILCLLRLRINLRFQNAGEVD
jgi:hypothetical protein